MDLTKQQNGGLIYSMQQFSANQINCYEKQIRCHGVECWQRGWINTIPTLTQQRMIRVQQTSVRQTCKEQHKLAKPTRNEFLYSRTTTLTNDHPYHTTTFGVTDSGFCSYTNPSRATIPLIRPHQCDSEGGRIRGVLLYRNSP